MGERDLTDVTETLRMLSRKELVRPARRSSIEGEAEYAFWHILARDVAYAQLPRASRSSRHVAAARWIESRAAERVEDLADVLAYHYATALELADAAGQTERAAELEGPALRFLSLAGERALGLDTNAALANLERALALTPEGHPERAQTLARFGEAALHAGHYAAAAAVLEEAIPALRSRADIRATAHAMGTFSKVLQAIGDPRQWTLPEEALALLEPLGPSPELVDALTWVAGNDHFQGRTEEAIPLVEHALALADALGLPRPAGPLGLRALARATHGDPGGLQDFREAIDIATDTGQGRELALLHNNLGMMLWFFEGPAAPMTIWRDWIGHAKARGFTDIVDSLTGSTLEALVHAGDHDAALKVAAEFTSRLEESGDAYNLLSVRYAQGLIFARRGKHLEVARALDWLESTARENGELQSVMPVIGTVAVVRAELGQAEAAEALLAEIISHPGARDNEYYPIMLPAMMRTALALHEVSLADRLVSGFEPRLPMAEHALVATNAALTEARGELQGAAGAYADAASRWDGFGVVPEQAFALLGQGRCLVGLSRPTEAAPVLQHAREIFERLKAAPALAEIDALLEQATALSS